MDAQGAAEQLLLHEMYVYSEDTWCARWLNGLEYEIWELYKRGVQPWLYLIDASYGIWHWPDDNSTINPIFIDLDEWAYIRDKG